MASDRRRLHENTSGGPFARGAYSRSTVPHVAIQIATEPALSPLRTESMDAPLRIDTIEHEGSLLLVVAGELDIVTTPLLDEALARARATDAASILVDLSAVSFIDSTGLHVLIRHACAGEGGPRVSLTTPSPQARRVFELSGLLDYLPFVSD